MRGVGVLRKNYKEKGGKELVTAGSQEGVLPDDHADERQEVALRVPQVAGR
jgi:hypothetical protein